MAIDLHKMDNNLLLTEITLGSLTTSTWNMLGETSFSFSRPMGTRILKFMEANMGLEIEGEDPKDVMIEISRVLVDEFGFCSNIEILEQSDGGYELKVKGCLKRDFCDVIAQAGVEKLFICPVLNSTQAALRRLGHKYKEDLEKWEEGNGTIITLKPL